MVAIGTSVQYINYSLYRNFTNSLFKKEKGLRRNVIPCFLVGLPSVEHDTNGL
jgi:hypothetical protein